MIDYRETLVTLLHSEDRHVAAKTLNISVPSLNYRINQMKKAGVKVPTPPKRRTLDNLMVAQLNSIIKKYKTSEAN